MPEFAKFLVFYLLLQSMICAIGTFAYRTGYFWDTPAQAQLREPEFRDDQRIGYLAKHGGIIGDALWLSLVAAFVMAFYGDKWNTGIFVGILVVVSLGMLPALEAWRQEGIKVPSALGRDGYLTIEAGIHYVYAALVVTVLLMFAGTPGVAVWHVWVVAGLIMCHVALGVLQPIYSSTGSIPPHTWVIFAAGEGATAVLAGLRVWMVHRYGW